MLKGCAFAGGTKPLLQIIYAAHDLPEAGIFRGSHRVNLTVMRFTTGAEISLCHPKVSLDLN